MTYARRAAAATLIAVMLAGVNAYAEPTAAERVVARARFVQGTQLEKKQDWAKALETFREVGQIVMSPNVHYHLGLCLEHTGKLVLALDEFGLAISTSNASASPDPDLLATSREHLSALQRRVPQVVVRLPAGSSASLRVDGAAMPSSLFGQAIPLDPGPHDIEVTAPSRAPFQTNVMLAERAPPVVVDVALEDGAPIADGTTITAPPTVPRPAVASAAADDRASTEPSHPLRTWAYVAGGTGIVAVGAAAIFYSLRASVISELDAACGGDRAHCPPSKRDLVDRGERYGTIANVMVGVAAATIVTAGVLFLLDPRSPKADKGRSARRAPSWLTFDGSF